MKPKPKNNDTELLASMLLLSQARKKMVAAADVPVDKRSQTFSDILKQQSPKLK